MPDCAACRRPLTLDEVGLTKKLINRGTSAFCCISCLAKHFCVPESALYRKVSEFREMGCTLFSHYDPTKETPQ